MSNLSLGHTQSVSHTHLFAHTHVHAHMITDTHNNPTGHMQDTKSCSETHTQPVSMYPWGGAVASVAAWCFISRTTHYYSNTRLFRCSNVLSILLNQLYMPPEGKQFTNTLPLWKNEMTFEWTHYMIILFYSHIMFFLEEVLRLFPFSKTISMLYLFYETIACASLWGATTMFVTVFNPTSEKNMVCVHIKC